MKLEHLLLGVLLMRPRTGYDLKRFMDLHGVFMRPRTQMSQVYRSLSEMHDRGWVTFTVIGRSGAQDAKVYQVTASGRTTFFDWLLSPFHPSTNLTSNELRARLWFSGFLGPEQLVAILDAEIDGRLRQVAKYRFRDRSIEVDDDTGFDLTLAELVEEETHAAGAAYMDMHIDDMRRLRALVAGYGQQAASGSIPTTSSRA